MKRLFRLPLIHSIAWGYMNEIRSLNPSLDSSNTFCDFIIENITDKVESRFNEWVSHINDTGDPEFEAEELKLTEDEIDYLLNLYQLFISHYNSNNHAKHTDSKD